MIMIVKTLGSQMGSPAAAEGRGEARGGGRGEISFGPQGLLLLTRYQRKQMGKNTRCCRVGQGTGGGSSGSAEFAAACLTLEDSLTHDRPIAVLTDSKGFMTVSSNWVGEGKDPLLRHSLDKDILTRIIKVLHQRVGL